jgi:hypothetical protein
VANDGAMTLFEATPQQHLALAKHLTAEVKTEEFVAGKSVIVKWERLRRQNHWFLCRTSLAEARLAARTGSDGESADGAGVGRSVRT